MLCGLMLFGMEARAVTEQSSRNLSPFSAVDISDAFEVRLVRGAEFRALITVEKPFTEYIICEVRDGVLYIGLDERNVPGEVKRQFRGKGTPDPVFSAVVYAPELLKSVRLSEKALLYDTEDLFDKAEVSFELVDNACIKSLSLSTLTFRVSMRGKSSADFKVGCREFFAETSAASSLKVEETSEVSSYNLAGSSKVTSKSQTGTLNVRTKANCTMSVSGSGDSADFNMNGTAEVDAFGFEVPDATISMTSVCKLGVSAYRSLKVNLSGGAALYFANEPSVSIESVKSSSIVRASGVRGVTKL